jgi:hypothetical protein
MADLFTHLAQGETDSEAVQPRLKTRFEDAAFEFAEDGPEAQTATDAEIALSAESAQARRERVEPTGSRGNLTVTGMRTIRNMTPVPDRQKTTGAERIPALPEVVVNTELPEQIGGAAEINTAPAVAQQPPATASKTIVERGGITPRGESPTSRAVSQQGASSGEMPQIQPAGPLVEFIPSSAGQATVIEVHIGRIELRQAAPPVQAPPTARPRFEPPLSLSDYLARRSGGSE